MNIVDINALIDDVNSVCNMINDATKVTKNKTNDIRSEKWKQICKDINEKHSVVKRINKEYAIPISGSGLEATYILLNAKHIYLVKSGRINRWAYLVCITGYVEKEDYYNYEWMNKLIDWWFDKRDYELYEKNFVDYVNKELVNKILEADSRLKEAQEEYKTVK